MRWVTPVLFTATAIFVAAYNTSLGDGDIIAFSFLEVVIGPDPVRLGQATVALLAAIGLVSGVNNARRGSVPPDAVDVDEAETVER